MRTLRVLVLFGLADCQLITALNESSYRENTPILCGDGADNDEDGAMDCDDDECSVLSECLGNDGAVPDGSIDADVDANVTPVECTIVIETEGFCDPEPECTGTETTCDVADQCGCIDQACYPTGDGTVCTTSGTTKLGFPCTDHDECEPGLFCPVGLCLRACDDPCDCEEDAVCFPGNITHCRMITQPCTPLSDDCGTENNCAFVGDVAQANFVTTCVKLGSVGIDGECSTYSDCQKGLHCSAPVGICRPYCDKSHPCEGGETCTELGNVSGCPDFIVSICS